MSETPTAGPDRDRMAAAIREFLSAAGLDPDSPQLTSTPRRVAEAYTEFFTGVGKDPAEFLADSIPVGADTGDLVLVRDIALRSTCEHHLLPFIGRAHIAYQPADRVVGLSALPRVVSTLASRPQVQERLGEEIADTIARALAPRGVLVVIAASHGCVTARGVREEASTTVTVAARGTLADPAARAETMTLIGAAMHARGGAGETGAGAGDVGVTS